VSDSIADIHVEFWWVIFLALQIYFLVHFLAGSMKLHHLPEGPKPEIQGILG